MLLFLLKGVLLGFIASLGLGAVTILIINRTFQSGRPSGFISGVGAALSDTLYASIAFLGVSLIIDLIDIWLPDFKYGNNKCGERLSKVSNYFDIITRNLSIICKEGDPIIIRHLVLPNHIRCCTEPVLKWIATNCKHALVNVMAQYRPEFLVLKFRDKYRDISRRPTKAEMSEAYALADELGLAYKEIS